MTTDVVRTPTAAAEVNGVANNSAWKSLALTLFRAGYELGWLAGRLGLPGPEAPGRGEEGPVALAVQTGVPLGADVVAPPASGGIEGVGAAQGLVDATAEGVAGASATPTRGAPPSAASASWWPAIVGWTLFLVGLAVYAYTRLVRLEDFPIYFFTDEAIHPVQGVEMISRGWRDTQGRLFPPYFQNGMYWNLSLSVYLHGIIASLLGKSILVTRATSALISVSAVVAVALALKWVYRARFWWASALVLTTMPAWFIHSRTAFEVVLMVSFYAWFLFFYLLYRTRSPRFLFPALLFGAATFYSYANGQSVMAVTGVLLLLSDLRYHLRHWRVALLGALVIAVLALPYLRFRSEHPEAIMSQLRILDSYLFRDISTQAKVQQFFSRYGTGLSPTFWFIESDRELIRHRWPGLAYLQLVTLPFWLIGVALVLWRFRASEYRLLLIATLAAPFGAALADVSLLRVLAFIVPASMLITLGIDRVFTWRQNRVLYALGTAAVLLLGVGGSLWMTREALDEGPTWFDNYGLYGMQWGTTQLFADQIPQYLRENPTTRVHVSHSWANGTDIFMRYFMPTERRVDIVNIDGWISDYRPQEPDAVFIMTPDEVERVKASGKFKPLQVERVIATPDGKDGFVFARPQYVDNIASVFAAEREARQRLVTGKLTWNGEDVTVNYSAIEAGQLKDMFDGDTFTLIRGREANPFVVEIVFPAPRPVSGLNADLGSMDFEMTVGLYPPGSDTPTKYSQTYKNMPPDPHIEIPFGDAPPQVQKVRIEVRNVNERDTAKIHIREIAVK